MMPRDVAAEVATAELPGCRHIAALSVIPAKGRDLLPRWAPAFAGVGNQHLPRIIPPNPGLPPGEDPPAGAPSPPAAQHRTGSASGSQAHRCSACVRHLATASR